MRTLYFRVNKQIFAPKVYEWMPTETMVRSPVNFHGLRITIYPGEIKTRGIIHAMVSVNTLLCTVAVFFGRSQTELLQTIRVCLTEDRRATWRTDECNDKCNDSENLGNGTRLLDQTRDSPGRSLRRPWKGSFDDDSDENNYTEVSLRSSRSEFTSECQ